MYTLSLNRWSINITFYIPIYTSFSYFIINIIQILIYTQNYILVYFNHFKLIIATVYLL